MIRKRNKFANDAERNQAEQKTREENLRRIQEQRAQLKQKQLELTNNLKKTYSHIRPTIIQGQRILKIIESLEAKMELLVPFSSRNLQILDIEALDSIFAKVKASLTFMKNSEATFFQLKEELKTQENLYRAYAEDDEEFNENDSRLIVNNEQEQIYQIIKKKEEELTNLCTKFKKETRNLLRLLSENPQIFSSIKNKLPSEDRDDPDNILKVCFDTIVSLKYLFLKKLSTGYDEQETHRRMMDKLKTSIEENERFLEDKETELRRIKEERASTIKAKNDEITSCKEDLEKIRKDEKSKLEQMRRDDEAKRQKTSAQHQERENKLKAEIARAIKDLEDLEKKNQEEETQLNKINDDLEKRIENLTSEYDTTVGALKLTFKEETVR